MGWRTTLSVVRLREIVFLNDLEFIFCPIDSDCSTPFDISVYTDEMDEAGTALGTIGANAIISRGKMIERSPCQGCLFLISYLF